MIKDSSCASPSLMAPGSSQNREEAHKQPAGDLDGYQEQLLVNHSQHQEILALRSQLLAAAAVNDNLTDQVRSLKAELTSLKTAQPTGRLPCLTELSSAEEIESSAADSDHATPILASSRLPTAYRDTLSATAELSSASPVLASAQTSLLESSNKLQQGKPGLLLRMFPHCQRLCRRLVNKHVQSCRLEHHQ